MGMPDSQAARVDLPHTQETLQQDDPIAGALLTFLDGVTFYKPQTVYISTPITTGPWFYEELARRGGRGAIDDLPPRLLDEVRGAAIAVNRRATLEALASIKDELPAYNFINPANLQVAAWSQGQYISFWIDVIERSAGQVVLSPGWSYSTGCTHECAKAISHGIATLDHRLRPVTREDAVGQVAAAIAHVRALGLEPASLVDAGKDFQSKVEETT